MTTDYRPGQAWLPPGGSPPALSLRHPEHRSLGEALPFGAPAPLLEPEPGPEPRDAADGIPGVGPVIVFTVLFGFFGAISAARRSSRAEVAGQRTSRYWYAFAWTLAGSWVLGILISASAALFLATVGAPAVTTADGISADWLEGSIVDQGQFAGADGQVTGPRTADCAGTRVGADGAGIYRCTIEFAGARRSVVDVTVSGNGEWKTA